MTFMLKRRIDVLLPDEVRALRARAERTEAEVFRLRSEREELLGALRSVAIQAHPPNGSGLTQGDIKLEMERIALTAIAKAEGRTP